MESTPIDAMAMTRRIREAHAEQLNRALPEERIRFFREKARRLHESLAERGDVIGRTVLRAGPSIRQRQLATIGDRHP
jgi:alpha-ketoglutarate-dependent taurine dioxygenase